MSVFHHVVSTRRRSGRLSTVVATGLSPHNVTGGPFVVSLGGGPLPGPLGSRLGAPRCVGPCAGRARPGGQRRGHELDRTEGHVS